MNVLWHWFVHFGGADNMSSVQYGLQSGLFPNILASFSLMTIPAAMIGYYLHHQCHEARCYRVGHPHEHVVKCKKHAR